MTYAYRHTFDQGGRRTVELFVSETNRPAPAGFVTCSSIGFRWAWRLRDALRVPRAPKALRDPYEAR